MIKAYIDASTKGNPGPSGGGIVLVSEGIHLQKAIPLSVLTNHQAEFPHRSLLSNIKQTAACAAMV